MNNENLLELMYGVAETVSWNARHLEPGEVVSQEGYGDDKRGIDQVAEDAAVEYFLENEPVAGFEAALKPEDAEWGEDAWMRGSGDTLSGEELREVDYGFIVDQVEGTKNYDNRERYTTLAAIDPENPTIEGVEAALVYRWDDTLFFSDGEDAFVNRNMDYGVPERNIATATGLEATRMDEVNYDTKVRGQMIGLNASDYANFIEDLVHHYELEESDWPSLKADGTTTGDILGAVTEKAIAMDVRALKERERLPFAQDFAPAARIARDSGVEIVDEKGEEITTDFSKPGVATAYLALPPGKVSEEVKNMLPELIPE